MPTGPRRCRCDISATLRCVETRHTALPQYRASDICRCTQSHTGMLRSRCNVHAHTLTQPISKPHPCPAQATCTVYKATATINTCTCGVCAWPPYTTSFEAGQSKADQRLQASKSNLQAEQHALLVCSCLMGCIKPSCLPSTQWLPSTACCTNLLRAASLLQRVATVYLNLQFC